MTMIEQKRLPATANRFNGRPELRLLDRPVEQADPNQLSEENYPSFLRFTVAAVNEVCRGMLLHERDDWVITAHWERTGASYTDLGRELGRRADHVRVAVDRALDTEGDEYVLRKITEKVDRAIEVILFGGIASPTPKPEQIQRQIDRDVQVFYLTCAGYNVAQIIERLYLGGPQPVIDSLKRLREKGVVK